VFAPSSTNGAEDDGYVMAIVHDTAIEKSRLIIIDAQNFNAPPLATIHLPQRVPYGAHGSWVPSGVITM
jgi:carotenoid cleavage dioxygenase